MGKPQLIKKLGQDIGWLALNYVFHSTKNCPLDRLHRNSAWLATMAYRLVRSRRNLMLTNLRLILPHLSEAQIERIARQTVQNIFRGLVDLFYLCWHVDQLPNLVKLECTKGALQAIQSDQGIIAATGHLGLFPLIIFPHHWQGRPCAVMVKDPHDKRVAQFFTNLRAKLNIQSINHQPPIQAARRATQLLQCRGVVLFAFDLHPGDTESVEVEFLGRRTKMFSAPVRFAAREGALIVPSLVRLNQDGQGYIVRLEDPIEVPPQASHRDSSVTVELVQRLANWLAMLIVQYPEQWWSIHRRWR